jgi:hypothetical protein
MLYKRYTFGNLLSDDFDKEVYDYLCDAFQGELFSYKILRNVDIPKNGRFINVSGIVISPYCIFTIEAIGYDGLVIKKNAFRDLNLITQYGQKYDFRDSEIRPAKLAGRQRKALENFLRFKCGIGGVWIKPILVFKPGATFQVPHKNRDISDPNSPYICSLDEIIGIITTLKPDKGVYLSPQRQEILVKAIEHGPETIKSVDKQLFDDTQEAGISAIFGGLLYRLRGRRSQTKPQPYPYTSSGSEVYNFDKPKRRWRLVAFILLLAIIAVVTVGLVRSKVITLPSGFLTRVESPTLVGGIGNEPGSGTLNTPAVPSALPGEVGTAGPTPTPYATNSIISEMIQTLNASNATESAPSSTPTEVVTNNVQACVLVQSVSVRAGPGKEYNDVGYLYNGECADLNGRSSDGKWAVFEGGWISVYPFYVSIIGDVMELPVIPPPRITRTEAPTVTPKP